MCPENEIKFRVENNLIHRIEEGKFMIKEYRRSAADTNDLDSVRLCYCKVGYVFSMVTWSEFRMRRYRDDDHREDAPQFINRALQ